MLHAAEFEFQVIMAKSASLSSLLINEKLSEANSQK